MRERKRIITGAKANLALSVHLNSFEKDTGVKGAQVFFPKEAPGELKENNKELAGTVQRSLNQEINTSRKFMAVEKGNMYLFRGPKEMMLFMGADSFSIRRI